jgi:hypothetical protein
LVAREPVTNDDGDVLGPNTTAVANRTIALNLDVDADEDANASNATAAAPCSESVPYRKSDQRESSISRHGKDPKSSPRSTRYDVAVSDNANVAANHR